MTMGSTIYNESFDMDSKTLIERCRKKDNQAWAEAYSYVHSHLKRKNIDQLNIEDIAQDTILYFFAGGINIIEKDSAFKSWLRTKANSLSIDYIRKTIRKMEDPLFVTSKSDKKDFLNPGVKPYHSDVIKKLFFDQALLLLENSLLQLDEKCRIILARYFKGQLMGELTKDMAVEFDLKPNTFSGKVMRCNQKLMSCSEYRELLKEINID